MYVVGLKPCLTTYIWHSQYLDYVQSCDKGKSVFKIPQIANRHDLTNFILCTYFSDMCWSPKMDIVAVAFLQTGDVTLYRLNWQKLWTLQGAKRSKTPEGGGTSTSELTTGDPSAEVTALSWRPDGKVLAVGYDDGHLILLDIEVYLSGQSLQIMAISYYWQLWKRQDVIHTF